MKGKGEPTSSTDYTQGQYSQRLSWSKVTGHIPTRVFPLHLKMDLKFTGKPPCINLRALGEAVNLGDQILSAKPETVRAEQRGHEAFGEIQYNDYIEHGCRVARRFVLTSDSG